MPDRRIHDEVGVVSVVLVNYRGADDTVTALDALATVDWPREMLDVVVVDNDSGGDDVARIVAAHPEVRMVEAGSNLGFAGGCNLGVMHARGEVLAFLNNDARPDSAWIRAAMAAFEAHPDVAAVASRVLDEEGRLVDYVDAALTWFGKGYKPFVGETAAALGRSAKDVLFATGSAMFVRAEDYRAVGGFDDRYFMFYEDVDLGWRLNLRGRRVRYEPDSIAFHRHHGSAGRYASYKEQYLLERNALVTLYKNLDQRRLDEVLAPALALTVRRGVTAGGLDTSSLDYRSGAADEVVVDEVPRIALASVYAIDQFLEMLPGLAESRAEIQQARAVSDAAIWRLFGRVDAIPRDDVAYARAHDALAASFPVTAPPQERRAIVVTGDPIGERIAGPAIRAMAIASALRATHRVTLVTTSRLEPVEAGFEIVHIPAGGDRAFATLERDAELIVFQGHAMAAFESLRASDKILVADIYDPMHLEQLEQGRELPTATWERQVADATAALNEQLLRGDFFLCASDRQRQFYLGQLAALGRINPSTYLGDPDLERLIAIVPFGLSTEPPVHAAPAMRGVVPGISVYDKVLLWSGGLYNWFDPHTLIRAVARLAESRPSTRLFFQGTKHPNPDVPEMEVVGSSRELARELGVLDSAVFFNDSWVPYDERQNFLLEADAGVSTHFQHVETTFSFRTRILDYLWSGLPMVVTDGDSFADLVQREDLGVVVPERDVEALAEALEAVLYDEERRAAWVDNVRRVRERFTWDRVLEPLVSFAREPERAADAGRPRTARAAMATPSHGLRRDIALAFHHLRHGGPAVVMRKVRRRFTR